MKGDRPVILLSGSSKMISTIVDFIPDEIHVIALPGLRISESGYRNLCELGQFGVLLLSDDRHFELCEAVRHLKSKGIPYLIGLNESGIINGNYFPEVREHFLFDQKRDEIRQIIENFVGKIKRNIKAKTNNYDHVWLRSAYRDIRINLQDIIYLSSDKDYIFYHITDKSISVRNTLKSVHSQLVNHNFERIHKSYIVQLCHITEIKTLSRNQHVVQLTNGIQLPIGRAYWPRIRRWLHLQQHFPADVTSPIARQFGDLDHEPRVSN